jgi:catechol 2,3-dioxygenase
MGAEPFDLEALLEEAGRADSAAGLPPGTVIGHVHLHVSRLDEAQRFYVDLLGFELTQRYGPSALFVSAGGYHHHIGLNTWAGVGAPPPPPGAIGLDHFVVALPDNAARDAVVSRLNAAGVVPERIDDGLLIRDPARNAILLAAADL